MRLVRALTLCGILISLSVGRVVAQNPYLPLWEHLPDGEPRVFEDPDNPGRYRAYIVGSHDTHYNQYCGNDVRMWSAPVENLTQWRDEGPIFSWFVDGQWDTMFAPDLVETVDRATGRKTYWLYPHSRGWGRVAMVCKGDRPDGPFTPVNLTSDGRRCVDGSLIDFDPSVFVEPITDKRDPDWKYGHRAYVFYGFRRSTAFELDPENMYGVRPGTRVHDYFLPASERYGVVRDPEGTTYPALYKGQRPGDFNFYEASSIRQVGNKYVMVFSGYSGPEYGLSSTNSALRYAYGDSPLGPWRSGGVLVDSRGVVPNEDGTQLIATNAAHNTHGSLQEIGGQWYVFYHRPPRGFGYARQAMVAPVKITWDKQPVSKGGKVTIAADATVGQPSDHLIAAPYTGAEVTSEGFQIYGLPPYRYYSAGLACYMTGEGSNLWMKDNHDVWRNGMDLEGITVGGIVGFKYFGFGGLAKSAKGVPAFEGTQKGDDTRLALYLTPAADTAVKIRVMLDGPYINKVWRGREIAVVDIPATHHPSASVYEVAVPAVEGLKGKHAIYLVCDEGKYSLHGIGFTRHGETMQPPTLPTVAISIDGRPLAIPSTPIRSTNANGLTDATHYQVYGPLHEGSRIEVKPSDPTVKVSVSPVTEGRATVKCTYQGQTKTYLIN